MSAALPETALPVASADTEANDPYQLRPEDVAEPPQSLWAAFRRIGPGMVLAASIVGSGELIATTTLGAQVGYAALWIIVLSCLIKPVVQAEMGRYIIASGETGLASFNHVPGPRLKVNWVVWLWALMVLFTMMQVGAMFGGVSQVMNLLIPALSVKLWVLIFAAITLALLLGGGYDRIEKFAMLKVGLFTMLTLMSAVLLMRMPQYFSWAACVQGLRPSMPRGGFSTAVAVFGITGVGASELFMYPYWCVEKGYARFTGVRDDSAGWVGRARGWIRVMHLDIMSSMVIYTVATLAFYLLGAGVLHGMGLVPSSNDMIPVLSNIYTQTLGGWALWLFYLGAVVTLYGTIFASIAAQSRMYSDMARLMGAFASDDYAARVRFRNTFIWILTALPVCLFLFFTSPVWMVKVGGIAQAAMLPIIGAATLYLRHRRLPRAIAPTSLTTFALWLSAGLMALMMGYSILEALKK
ncbi:MAG: Nramp family divalent metal transporter [Acidobacteria bacterium]|nr:Nramp family divalent metal transporter [Acidobacteriota bacterium]MBI3427025.1 Nramp family divalent metal transporter [Acidobacteriota bacterium]